MSTAWVGGPVVPDTGQRGNDVMQILGRIDTEQTIERSFYVEAPEDGSEDFPVYYRGGTFRARRVRLIYRVNRGATVPRWYCFTAKVTAGKVLTNGAVSVAPASTISESFAMGPASNGKAPAWLVSAARDMLPTVPIEGV